MKNQLSISWSKQLFFFPAFDSKIKSQHLCHKEKNALQALHFHSVCRLKQYFTKSFRSRSHSNSELICYNLDCFSFSNVEMPSYFLLVSSGRLQFQKVFLKYQLRKASGACGLCCSFLYCTLSSFSII